MKRPHLTHTTHTHTPHTHTHTHTHRDIVEYLLSNGASLLVHDIVTKRTPLHAAAFNGHTDTVQAMLKNMTSTTHIDCVDMLGRCVGVRGNPLL